MAYGKDSAQAGQVFDCDYTSVIINSADNMEFPDGVPLLPKKFSAHGPGVFQLPDCFNLLANLVFGPGRKLLSAAKSAVNLS